MPRLCTIADGTRVAPIKLGSDNPDNLYQNAQLDSSRSYIITGIRGTVYLLGFGTQSGEYGGEGNLKTIDYLEAEELIYDDEYKTSFRILLSSERPDHRMHSTRTTQPSPPNWLRLDKECTKGMLIVRQTFGVREMEVPATIRLSYYDEELEMTTIATRDDNKSLCSNDRIQVYTPQDLEQGLRSTILLVNGATAMFAKWAHNFQSHANTLPLFDQQTSDSVGGDPNIRYFHSYWNIAKDQALVIQLPANLTCKFWNFQLNNYWMESLDYRYYRIHTNSFLAEPDCDDVNEKCTAPSSLQSEVSSSYSTLQRRNNLSYTIIVAHSNPNSHNSTFRGNWITSAGHYNGTMCLRYVFSPGTAPSKNQVVHPKVTLVPFSSFL